MTELTPEALDRLETLAQAATQGEWRRSLHIDFPYESGYEVYLAPADGGYFGSGGRIGEGSTPSDAEYIAAAQPATILALIAEVRRMRADWLREATSRDELMAKIERLRDACRTARQDDWGLEYLYVSTILHAIDGGAS